MSNVPRAVQEAEERAERLQQELIARQQQPGDNPPADPSASENPPTDPPNNPENPAPTNDSQTPPAPQQQDDNWEHRFKVLQGKYNSEVPRFANELKELKTRLENLQSENEQLKIKPPEPLVTPEEVEEYGPGLVDLARRIAKEEMSAKDAEINRLKSQIQSISEATSNTVTNDFFRSLSAIVPDWEKLNEDPGFLRWLDEVDELTGEQRFALLDKAQAARDAARAAKFFNAYKKTSQTWAATSTQSLENQLVPTTNKTPDTPPSKKIWTRGEITEFYSRMRRGAVSDKDAIAIEADITAASIEGRIR
jgi:hypothetical protein